MSTTLPAPIWRRAAASVYDGLLLLAIWMVVALLSGVVQKIAGADGVRQLLQLELFAAGLAFFGWFWTHGGQTLGMRVWRLRVRRADGAPLRWPVAAIRYAVLLTTWFAALLPALMQVPGLAAHVHAQTVTIACTAYTIVAFLAMRLDRRRRALCDWAARTEVVLEPPKVRTEQQSG